ncbi:MAG: hypothetical protein WA040_17240, partial [Anaerolineae bacterium]
MKSTSNTATALLWALSILLILAGASLALVGWQQNGVSGQGNPAFVPGLVAQALDPTPESTPGLSPLATPTDPARPTPGS